MELPLRKNMNLADILKKTSELLEQQLKKKASTVTRLLSEQFEAQEKSTQRFSWNNTERQIIDHERKQNIRLSSMLKTLHQNLPETNEKNSYLKKELSSTEIRQEISEAFGQIAPRLEEEISFQVSRKVREVYAEEHLGSCMYHKGEGHPSLESYNQSRNVYVVSVRKKNSLLARALLWDCVNQKGERRKAMDRIYPADPNHHGTKLLTEHAREQGWMLLENSTKRGSHWNEDIKCIVTISEEGLPYMDNMRWVEARCNNLMLLSSKNSNPQAQLAQRTDGNKHLLAIEDFDEHKVLEVAKQLWGKDDPDLPRINEAQKEDYQQTADWFKEKTSYDINL